jgi:hypothetical protein
MIGRRGAQLQSNLVMDGRGDTMSSINLQSSHQHRAGRTSAAPKKPEGIVPRGDVNLDQRPLGRASTPAGRRADVLLLISFSSRFQEFQAE